MLLSTVVIPSLRGTFPDAKIDFLTEKPSREVLLGNPAIDTLLVFDGKKQSGIELIMQIRKQKYDLVFDLFGNPRSALVTRFSSATYRIGYDFGWRKHCYNIVVKPRGGEVHNTEFNLDALRACDIPLLKPILQFTISDEADAFAEQFFKNENLLNNFVVALNAAGGWYTKRWGIRKYARLGDLIAEKHHARILLLWGPGEYHEVEGIAAMMTRNPILIPQTSLQQLAAMLKRCTILVTNDSGPMHIAASVGTPTVAIFGPTNPMLQGPFGNESEIIRNEKLECLSCNLTKCTIGNPCMEDLTVEEVYRAFEKLESRIASLPQADVPNL